MQSADQVKFLMNNNNSVVTPECTCLFQPGSVPGRQKAAACWILVYFPAEDAVGHPILLQEVETLMGDTGDQAGLGEGDTCLAPFFVGDGLHTARIIKCSEERTELLQEYGKILNLRKTSDGDFLSKIGKVDTGEHSITENSHKHVSKWRYVNYLGGGIALGGLTVVAAPVVFTAGGGALVAATVATKVVPILALVGVGSMAAKDIMVEEEVFDKEDKIPTKAAGKTCKDSDTATTGSDTSSVFSTTGLSSAVQGVFSWFSGSSHNQGKEEGKEKHMKNSSRNNAAQDETLIDLSEDPKAPLHVNHTRSKTMTLDPQREQGQRGQDRVKLENQRLWEERRCKICGGGETAVLFDPCGHMCACVDCSAVQRHCPLCGQFISHHHRVFRA